MMTNLLTNTTNQPAEFNGELYDQRHGGPFDRGAADSYYNRARRPHYFAEATYTSTEFTEDQMSPAQISAYHAGYDYNEQLGEKKYYG